MLKILLLCAFLCIGFILYEGTRFALLIQKGKEVIAQAVRYERIIPNATASILVIGDSTGFGTGSKDPVESIAGRLGTFYTDASVVNRSENGMKLHALREAVGAIPSGERHDLILLQIGGNDILQFSSKKAIEEDLRTSLKAAKDHAHTIILMSTGNVGSAPAFDRIVGMIYEARTREIRELFMRVAREEGVSYVDLFAERKDDPFVREPARYHAADGLHPTGSGYGLWFQKLKPLLPDLISSLE